MRVEEKGGGTDWAVYARNQLDQAKKAFQERDFETSMAAYHSAERFMIYGFEACGQEDLRTQVLKLQEEAQQVAYWSPSFDIGELIENEEDLTANCVVEAYRLLHELQENKSEIYSVLTRRLTILVVMISLDIIAILLMLYYTGQDGYFFLPTAPIGRWELALSATLFGLGGGLFYVLAGTVDQAVSDTPGGMWLRESTWWAVVGRAVLGGFTGLTVLILANSGVFATQIITAPLIVVLAFAFGLYLQKFLGLVESVTGVFDKDSSPAGDEDRS